MEDIISDLQNTQEAVVTAPPIAAKPGQLREQLDANRAIIDAMDRKLADLQLVRQDADRMIEEAGGVEDESTSGEYTFISSHSLLLAMTQPSSSLTQPWDSWWHIVSWMYLTKFTQETMDLKNLGVTYNGMQTFDDVKLLTKQSEPIA